MRSLISMAGMAAIIGLGGCSPSASTDYAPLPVGSPMPELRAEGWINGDAPAPSDLSGKVVVIDCWAYW